MSDDQIGFAEFMKPTLGFTIIKILAILKVNLVPPLQANHTSILK